MPPRAEAFARPRIKAAGKGQAMVESVIACLFVTFLMLIGFELMHRLTARILLDHAAARAARARSVGLDDFMCEKSARAAMIPVAGERTWPEYDVDEVARIPIYLAAGTLGRARGVLDYEHWGDTSVDVDSESGVAPRAKAEVKLETDELSMNGKAEIESHFPLYMYDQGL